MQSVRSTSTANALKLETTLQREWGYIDALSQHAVWDYKFTGKERDSESGLDNFGARYNASSMGRFMSPDPLGGVLDPQTLQQYAYVRNNPTTLIDPTGMYTCADQADCKSKQDIAFEKSRQQDLKSKDSDVVRAAGLAVIPQADNGVGVVRRRKRKGCHHKSRHRPRLQQSKRSARGRNSDSTVWSLAVRRWTQRWVMVGTSPTLRIL